MGWLFLSCIAFTIACSDSVDDDAEKTIHLGLLAPLTGSISSAGISGAAAIDLAVEDINEYLKTTNSHLQVNIEVSDDETNPNVALERLQDFHKKGIRYVIGPYTSANAAAVLDYANQNGIILISPASVATALSIPDDNLFRVVPDDQNQALAIAALFEYDDVDYIIPIVRSDVWGDGLIANVTQLVTQQGKTLVTPIRFDPANVNTSQIITDVSAAINLTLQEAPAAKTAVYLLSFGEGATILSAAAGTPDCALVRWYGSSAFATNASLLLDNAASDFSYQQTLRCPIFAPDEAAKDLWQPIVTTLTTQLGRTPESYALSSYDALWLMTLAYRDAADPNDVELFKASLMRTAGLYYGITGRTTLNDAGDRKYATLGILGLSLNGGVYNWKEFGNYSNSTGQLIIY